MGEGEHCLSSPSGRCPEGTEGPERVTRRYSAHWRSHPLRPRLRRWLRRAHFPASGEDIHSARSSPIIIPPSRGGTFLDRSGMWGGVMSWPFWTLADTSSSETCGRSGHCVQGGLFGTTPHQHLSSLPGPRTALHSRHHSSAWARGDFGASAQRGRRQNHGPGCPARMCQQQQSLSRIRPTRLPNVYCGHQPRH